MIDAQVGVLLFPQYALTFKGTGNILHRVFFLDSYHNSNHTLNDFRTDFKPDLPRHYPPTIGWCGLVTYDYFVQMSKCVASKQPFYCFWLSHIINISIYDSTSGCFQAKSCDSQWERADQEGSAARCTQIYLWSYMEDKQNSTSSRLKYRRGEGVV